MRLGRPVLVLFLTLTLLPLPAASAPRALGMVLQAEKARAGSGEAIFGATVFSGDMLTTRADGALRLRMGTAQVYLLPASSALLEEHHEWNVIALRRGGAGFSTAGAEPLVMRINDVQVYPASTQPTHGEVTSLGPNEMLITSFRGPLEVMIGEEVHAVAEGSVYRFTISEAQQEPEPAGKSRGSRRRGALVFLHRAALPAAIIAAIIVGIVLYNNRDVSPFVQANRPFPLFSGR